MKAFSIPVSPMLGCIATAVGPNSAPPRTQDSGSYGGNMDFNGPTEGATLYLPVSNSGALLYLGDGHALQGDGELNGNALETSMDVEFTVDVIPKSQPGGPRIETSTDIIPLGFDGSIDDAFKDATDNMASCLMDDYKLTASEVTVLGVAADYHVGEVADATQVLPSKSQSPRFSITDFVVTWLLFQTPLRGGAPRSIVARSATLVCPLPAATRSRLLRARKILCEAFDLKK